MKKFILSLFASLLITTAVWAQAQGSGSTNAVDLKVKFKQETVDFGTTKFNKPVTVTFEFTNISKAPVLIESAKASCGCTVPNWTVEPVLPGKSGKITATYSANAVGKPTKTVYLKLKGVDQEKELILTGTVEN
ncbi:DUF1573 domain-containing protein [Chitinophaga sp. XS-30]|uniref:DUF1573 domain-containing protein n=1 Tax=Chitinophaga sp. XS-30 TaxID=2604421 RepID=UPI0011DCBD6B|nr:DUF1573 domain-containing protein [Chitinophaga sp. XS-30]QEH43471.1 DUF1573 domain-containing protein [Chitinophaga sp. XS-30]